MFIITYRARRPEVVCKKGVLKVYQKRDWLRCFPVNFEKFLRRPFFIEHLRWVLLNIQDNIEMLPYHQHSFINFSYIYIANLYIFCKYSQMKNMKRLIQEKHNDFLFVAATFPVERNTSGCWSVFSRIRTEYGEILCISPYSVRMQEKTDQK